MSPADAHRKESVTDESSTQRLADVQTPADHHFHFHFPSKLSAHWSKNFRSLIAKIPLTDEPIPPCTPGSEIFETDSAYYIDIEVPGVTDKGRIHIFWTSPTTLDVEGSTERPARWGHGGSDDDASTASARAEKPNLNGKSSKNEDGGELHKVPKVSDSEDTEAHTKVWFSSRKLGDWVQSFTLPNNVDMDALRAKLDTGLLRIYIPKRSPLVDPAVQVDIE
ncbi:hypothetical protein MMC25_007742 [Agyrium rufum]|nr:hypothetical protein [Agyrium rufum]